MNLPRGFKSRIKEGHHPPLPIDGDPPNVGREWKIAQDLSIVVTGISTKEGMVQYLVRDHRANLLRAALPSRPGSGDPNIREDRDAGRESAYTTTAKRALGGVPVTVSTKDGRTIQTYMTEPEGVDEETLTEFAGRARSQWDALHAERQLRRQTDGTVKRLRKLILDADRQGRGSAVLREMQTFLDRLEADLSSPEK